MIRELSPQPDSISKDFYQAKKLISKFGLKEEKIDYCVKGCMLCYQDDVSLTHCEICENLCLSPRERKVGGIKMFLEKEYIFCP